MAIFLVTLDLTKSGYNLIEGVDSAIVSANSESEAQNFLAAYFNNEAWDVESTATEITAQASYEGWRYRIKVNAISVTVTADSDDTVDDIGAKLVTALNATAINGAAYNTGSNVLTIVQTTDNLGDAAITVEIMAPTGVFGEGDFNFTSFWSTLTAPGAVGIARTVTLLDVARPKPYGSGIKKL